MDTVQSLLIHIGGAGLAFVLLFQYLGKKWLDNMFSQRLNNLKHQQDLEVARLRIEIDSMLNGALRLQEKEFVILPKIWELIDRCFFQLIFVTNPFKSYSDIDSMSEGQVDDLLAMTKFTDTEKNAVKQAHPKSPLYKTFLTYERVNDARSAATELGDYLSLNGILIPLDLKEKLVQLSTELTTVAQKVRTKVMLKKNGIVEEHHGEVENLRPLMNEIESLIHKRLASHAKAFNG